MDNQPAIKLRGHHLDGMTSDFYHSDSLRMNCEYRARPFTETSAHIDQKMLVEWYSKVIRENSLISLTDEPDSICTGMCSWKKIDGESVVCGKNYYDAKEYQLKLEDLIRGQKDADHKTLREWGFNVGDTLKFSGLFKRLVNQGKEHFEYHGDNTGTFEENLIKVLHPRLVELYRIG